MTENYFGLQSCEQCGTILQLNKYTQVFNCPICGTMNVPDEKRLTGQFNLESPEMVCETDPENDKLVLLKDINPKLDKAIRTLMNNGWKLKFTGE